LGANRGMDGDVLNRNAFWLVLAKTVSLVVSESPQVKNRSYMMTFKYTKHTEHVYQKFTVGLLQQNGQVIRTLQSILVGF